MIFIAAIILILIPVLITIAYRLKATKSKLNVVSNNDLSLIEGNLGAENQQVNNINTGNVGSENRRVENAVNVITTDYHTGSENQQMENAVNVTTTDYHTGSRVENTTDNSHTGSENQRVANNETTDYRIQSDRQIISGRSILRYSYIMISIIDCVCCKLSMPTK